MQSLLQPIIASNQASLPQRGRCRGTRRMRRSYLCLLHFVKLDDALLIHHCVVPLLRWRRYRIAVRFSKLAPVLFEELIIRSDVLELGPIADGYGIGIEVVYFRALY